MYSLEEVRREDPEIAAAIEQEMARQNDHIELIASALIAAIESPDNQEAYRKDLLQYFDVDGIPISAIRICLSICSGRAHSETTN